MDFLRYVDLCAQYLDESYRQYVAAWCFSQIFDEDETEE